MRKEFGRFCYQIDFTLFDMEFFEPSVMGREHDALHFNDHEIWYRYEA